jgi:hypothetical protein
MGVNVEEYLPPGLSASAAVLDDTCVGDVDKGEEER